MRHLIRSLILLLFFCATAFAQNEPTPEQIATDFAQWLPQMSAEDLGQREAAQQGWQRYCLSAGAPGKTESLAVVNRLMSEQLDKDIPVVSKVWLLHELAWTAGASEVEAIAKLLGDPELKIRDEAMRTLAKISAPEAKQALEAALKNADGAEQKRLQAAVEAIAPVSPKFAPETEMPQAFPYAPERDAIRWLRGYAKMNDIEKASAVAEIAVRQDPRAFSFVLEALKSDDLVLKRSAILALDRMGTKEQVPVLLDNAITFDRGICVKALSNMVGPGIEDVLLAELKKETDQDRLLLIGEVLCKRYCREAIDPIFAVLKKPEFDHKIALLRFAESIASLENVGLFVDALPLIEDRGQRDNAEQIIARICDGDAKPVIAKMTGPAKLELLPLLGRVGGEAALAFVNKELQSDSAETHNAAIRAICNWPNAVVSQELLKIAENTDESEQNRIAALRALIRVVSLPDDRIGIAIGGKDKLEMMKKAMSIATRNNEKALILDRLGAVRENETVEYALGFVDDPELSTNACRAIVDIAHHDYMRRANKALFEKALDKVIDSCKDAGLVDRAKRYKANM